MGSYTFKGEIPLGTSWVRVSCDSQLDIVNLSGEQNLDDTEGGHKPHTPINQPIRISGPKRLPNCQYQEDLHRLRKDIARKRRLDE
jgi:hypothetical protein